MMLLKSHLLSVFLASLAFNFPTLYAQGEDDDVAMMKKMCACASKHNLCNKKCPDISEELFKLDDDDECKEYAFEAFGCGDAFSSTEKYKKLCPKIGVPCTTAQRMCACASKHNLCDKKCDALFDVVDDPDCQNYAGQGACSGFPLRKTYKKVCPKIGMPCTTAQQMCACASKHDLCDKKCDALFDVVDDPVCQNYAGQGACSGFPLSKTYAEQCKKKKIKMPCNTNSQKMCACANKHRLCSKTCGELFNIDDDDCQSYLINSICGEESFPSDVRYQDHCKTEGINMKCKRGACKNNKKWTIKIGYDDKSCEWVRENPSTRCNDDEGSNGKSSNQMCKDSCDKC